MAKRKGAATSKRKRAAARSVKARPAARKKAAAKKKVAARRAAAGSAKPKTAAKRRARTAAASRKAAARKKTVARKAASVARKRAQRNRKSPAARKVARTVKARTAKPPVSRREPPVTRKAPALNRDRRTISDEDMVPTPPSSLDLDRSASAARSGRRAMRDRFDEHTETSPALTGGDVDADWESAYSVGDEAPGGDNPTPDQDIVDDIGRAVGVEYQDNEELKGDEKIADRDRHRWELDPASAEDYDEH